MFCDLCIIGVVLLLCIILFNVSNKCLFRLFLGWDNVKLLVVKLCVLSKVIVIVLFIIKVVVVFVVGVRFSGYVFWLILM